MATEPPSDCRCATPLRNQFVPDVCDRCQRMIPADRPPTDSLERAVLDACRAYYEDTDADSDDVLLPIIARWLEAENG